MNKDNKKGHLIAYGMLIGFVVGFILDLYELAIFGDVGLGIVFGPMIGLLLGAVYRNNSVKDNKNSNSK